MRNSILPKPQVSAIWMVRNFTNVMMIKPETVENRIKVYQEQTAPLIAYYRIHGLLAEVDGTKPIEEVTTDLIDTRSRKLSNMSWDRQITIKTAQELEIMREAGRINAEALAAARAIIRRV